MGSAPVMLPYGQLYTRELRAWAGNLIQRAPGKYEVEREYEDGESCPCTKDVCKMSRSEFADSLYRMARRKALRREREDIYLKVEAMRPQ